MVTGEVRSKDGTRIGFVKAGCGVPLVIVHGALNTGEQWMPVAGLLADRCTCYVMDRRGRGRSGDSGEYSADREVEDIEAVLDAAGPDARLAGHSAGAIYALETARRRAVPALVLYEPPLHFRTARGRAAVDRIRDLVTQGRPEEGVILLAREEAGLNDDKLSALRGTPLWTQMVALVPTFIREWDGLFHLPPDLERYRTVRAPTLLLAGSETQSHPAYATKSLARVLPVAKTVILPGQGHAANVTAPGQVAGALAEFLRAQPA
jgi:pimeloyl-ACP methyl ester carboxylesterase